MKNLYSGYSNYFATGEGTTTHVCLLVAGSEEHALEIISHHVDEFYLKGFDFEKGISEIVKSQIPSKVLETLEDNPPYNFFWISNMHFNYS